MKQFMRSKGWILDIVLVVCFIFFLSFWGTRFPVMFFGMLSAAFIVLRRIDYKKHFVFKRILLIGFGIAAVSFVIIEALVFTQLHSDDPEEADYVIILGSGIRGTELSLTLKQRLDASLDYIRAHPDIPVIVSGGQGPGEAITEALAMRTYLVEEQGIDPGQVLMEDKSTSTQENLAFSKKIIEDAGNEHPEIMLVTSDYHMFRAKYLASKNGFASAYGISAPSPMHLKPVNMIREYFAAIKAFL